MSITDLLTRAQQIKKESAKKANTAERVGGLLEDMVSEIYKVTETDYATLKGLYDSEKLTPGQLYKFRYTPSFSGNILAEEIRDGCNYLYKTVIEVCSGGHDFYLTVRAIDHKTLYHVAMASMVEDDDYFCHNANRNYGNMYDYSMGVMDYIHNSNLSKWVIHYDISPDERIYPWYEPDGGTGVISFMEDERGNSAYYDFKNVKFRDPRYYNYEGSGYVGHYTFCSEFAGMDKVQKIEDLTVLELVDDYGDEEWTKVHLIKNVKIRRIDNTVGLSCIFLSGFMNDCEFIIYGGRDEIAVGNKEYVIYNCWNIITPNMFVDNLRVEGSRCYINTSGKVSNVSIGENNSIRMENYTGGYWDWVDGNYRNIEVLPMVDSYRKEYERPIEMRFALWAGPLEQFAGAQKKIIGVSEYDISLHCQVRGGWHYLYYGYNWCSYSGEYKECFQG